MNWLFELHRTQPIAQAIGVFSFVCVLGMALGSVKFRGIGLGTAGVLFAGILVGHFSEPVEHHTLDFVKEFGMILFVFTIGLQLGPGFFAALRHQDIEPDRLLLPALAYAVTYPTAIAGVIGTLLLLKLIFRINPVDEAMGFAALNRRIVEPLERRTLVVTNPNLAEIPIASIPGRIESGVTISRVPGTMPIAFPMLPQPVRLGLAGGPLIVALAFASNIAGSDAPTVAYATVYPLTTLLRILSAQILAITLVG